MCFALSTVPETGALIKRNDIYDGLVSWITLDKTDISKYTSAELLFVQSLA